MIEPQSARLDFRNPPRISYQALSDLRRVLDVALSLLNVAAAQDVAGEGDAT